MCVFACIALLYWSSATAGDLVQVVNVWIMAELHARTHL